MTAAVTLAAMLWPAGYTARAGRPVELTWTAIVGRCSAPAIVRKKEDAPGWSFTRSINNRRTKQSVQRLSAVVLDVDGGEQGDFIAAAEALELAGCRAVLHTTHSHRTDAERFRVIVPLSRAVTSEEFPIVARYAAAVLPCDVDPGSFDPCHTWRCPSHAPGAPYEYQPIDGEPLEVEVALAAHQGASRPITGSTTVQALGPTRPLDQILGSVPARVRKMIERGPTLADGYLRRASESGAWVADRSRHDYAVIGALVDAGCNDDEIRLVFESFPEGCGQRCVAIGARAPAYLDGSIAKARTAAATRMHIPVCIERVYVRRDDFGGVESVRLVVEPLKPCAPGEAHPLPRGITLAADCPERWDAAFAACDLDTPDPKDGRDTQAQAFAMAGETVVLEVDPVGVRRILAANAAA